MQCSRRPTTRFESLETRQLLATIATLAGTQAIFTSIGANDDLTITRTSGGQLAHNRFAAGDAGFASALDFNSILGGVQTLFSGASTKITYDGNQTGRLTLDDTARTTAGTYDLALDSLTLPDGTQTIFNDSIDILTLLSGNGNDAINLTASRALLDLNIETNGGNDTLFAGSGGSLDTLQSKTTSFDGGPGSDKAVFNDEADTSSGNGYNLKTNFSRTNGPSIALTSADSCELRTTAQGDTIDLYATGSVSGTFLVVAGAGPDDIDINSVSSANWTSYTVDAGSGDDSIRILGTSANKSPQIISGSGADSLSLEQPSGTGMELVFDHSERLSTLSLDYGATLTLAPGGDNKLVVDNTVLLNGNLDIGDNTVILRTPPSQDQIRGRVRNAWTNGAFNANVLTSITSAVARATTTPGDTIGYASASDLGTGFYEGEFIGGDDLILTYTRMGDVNLNGTVNFDDLLKVAQNYGANTRHWVSGNLDYDNLGKVDFTDLLLLAQNYGFSTLQPSTKRSCPIELIA